MALTNPAGTSWPVWYFSDASVPVGTVGYLQIGTWGQPMGLLLSITTTPAYKKVIQTTNGLVGVV